ncbi:PIG-L deacetylase family protein [Nesterenkonia flava]
MTQPTTTGLLTPKGLIDSLGLQRVLAIGAHPDDMDFGAAATLAGLTAGGVHVTLALLTAGDAGGFDTERDPEETARLRHVEQQEAAEVLGIDDVVLLGEKDGFVEPSYELIGKIVKLMRQTRPDAVVSMHPERAWDRLQKSHPDHLACGEAVVRASYPAVENPFAYSELHAAGLEAFKIKHLLLAGAPQHLVTTRVDVTETAEKKIQALRRHFSQMRDPQKMEQYVLEQMRGIYAAGLADASATTAPSGYAEEFHHVVVNDPATISGF